MDASSLHSVYNPRHLVNADTSEARGREGQACLSHTAGAPSPHLPQAGGLPRTPSLREGGLHRVHEPQARALPTPAVEGWLTFLAG